MPQCCTVPIFANKIEEHEFPTEDKCNFFQFNLQFGNLTVAVVHNQINNTSKYVEFH